MTARLTFRLCLLSLVLAGRVPAQPSTAATGYRKLEARIPMRDGALLFTHIYVPTDTSRTFPFLMQRTPYSVAPYGAEKLPTRLGPSAAFQREGFIFVHQDVRGRYQSTGTWREMTPHQPAGSGAADVNESTDTYDTITWLLEHVPRHNGKVGLWGISYPGFYVTASSLDAHPALVAVSPQAPATDLYDGDDLFHNGAFMLAANAGFYRSFRPHRAPVLPDSEPRPSIDPAARDGYAWFLGAGQLQRAADTPLGANPYWAEILQHPTYDDHWRARAIQRQIIAGVQFPPASLTVGGWYDAEDPNGPLLTYRAIAGALGVGDPRGTTVVSHHLVMGPWAHGQFARDSGTALGPLRFGSATGVFYRDSIEFPFFMQHLKGAAPAELAAATLYDTGRDAWRTFARWPAVDQRVQPWFLQANASLDTLAPAAGSAAAADRYPSDPARPVPYTERIVAGMARDYITDDQRFASRRPDVLTYRSAPLTGDLTVGGGVNVVLHVATTGTDADFVVRLIDEYPDGTPGDTASVRMAGFQRLVRGEPFRARYRRGFDRAIPFVANRPDSLRFTLPDVLHTFRAGNRVMVQVSSSWFPLVDRNPQVFVPNIFTARPGDFRRAEMTLFHTAAQASRIELPVLP
ncbi:MAG: CocE/NonD family hydrolase [Gemmatimonadaceae bacterium]|nr:CocE/NonD family hydrolase [Gemmatimonadaceae bacterium]